MVDKDKSSPQLYKIFRTETLFLFHFFRNEKISYIIKDEKTFNEIFIENSMDVNFEKEMVILFMKRDVSPRDCYLLSISNDYNGKLTFKYVHEFYIGGGDTVMPYPRCIAVKMKKKDITSVEFIDVY